MSNLAVKEKAALARPLKILVPLIQKEIQEGKAAAEAAGMEYYRRAGELLLEAKAQLQHGEWGAWLKRNFPLSHVQAARYMKLATVTTKFNVNDKFDSLREFSDPNRSPRIVAPAWHEPIRESISRVNLDRLTQERQSREKEDRLIHQLGMQLIDLGYKALATKLHPDKGGSSEAMARLNRVRDLLKRAL